MKRSLVTAGALLVLLVSCMTGLAQTAHGGQRAAGSENGAFVVPDLEESENADRPDVQLLGEQRRNRRISTVRKVRGDRDAAEAAELEARPHRSSDENDGLSRIVLSVVAGTMGIGGVALLVSSLRRRPSKRHKHALAAAAVPARNSTQRRSRGRPALAAVSIMSANQKNASYSVSDVQEVADLDELQKAA